MVDNGVITREGVQEDESGRNIDVMLRNKTLRGRIKEVGDQLLPGIPDEITVDRIAPKLPWTDCQVFWLVSRAWQRAIQSRQIYDARVRSQCTHAFVVTHSRGERGGRAISLQSVSNIKTRSNLGPLMPRILPPIPGLKEWTPLSSQCTCLDGKVYILGGLEDDSPSQRVLRACDTFNSRARVYVLDLVGQRQWKWKECARMKAPRNGFGCGVINGKIYAFGGICPTYPLWGCEVYDPSIDAWSPIASRDVIRGFIENVITVGEELFVCIRGSSKAEVYHPLMDRWRSVEQFSESGLGAPFLMGGKLHRLSPHYRIDVFDSCRNLWEPLQRFSSVGGFGTKTPFGAVAMKDELLGTVACYIDIFRDEDGPKFPIEVCLMSSQGLGCEDKKNVWRMLQHSLRNKLPESFLPLVHL